MTAPGGTTADGRLRLVATLPDHGKPARLVTWSPDGSLLAAVGSDKVVQLWRADGTHLATLAGHTYIVTILAWSPDSTRLATGTGGDPTLRLWRADGTLLTALQAHAGGVMAAQWSPDSRLLASAGSDRAVRLWDAGGAPQTVFDGHRWPVHVLAWAPDSAALAFAPGDSSIEVWTVEGARLGAFTGHAKPASITGLGWSRQGEVLVSGDGFGNLMLWRTNGQLVTTLRESVKPPAEGATSILAVSWAPNGETLAALSGDGTVTIWDAGGARLRERAQPGPATTLRSFGWLTDGVTVVVAVSGHDLLRLNARTGAETVFARPGGAIGCVWSPDGAVLATTLDNGTVQLWR